MPKQRKPLLIVIGIVLLAMIIVSLLAGPIGYSVFHLNFPEWMKVPTPVIELPAEPVLHFGSFVISNSMLTAWITVIVLVVLSIIATRRMKLVPTGLQALFEYALEFLLNFCNSVAGEKNGRRFFPYVATIFLFVITNAYLSLIPGYGSITVSIHEGSHILNVPLLRGANTDINVPLALAIFTFVVVEFYGIRSLKLKYFKKFINVEKFGHGIGQIFKGRIKSGVGGMFLGVVDIFVGIVETLSELIRLVSLTARLFGNMTAGEILLVIVAFLVPMIIPMVFYVLESVFGFIQALVFAVLTLVYLTMAVSSHEAEEHAS